MRGGEDFGLCITVGHKVLLNRSNKCYGGGGGGGQKFAQNVLPN